MMYSEEIKKIYDILNDHEKRIKNLESLFNVLTYKEISEIEEMYGDLHSAPEEDLLRVKEELKKALRFLEVNILTE